MGLTPKLEHSHLTAKQVDDLKGVLYDANGHQLLPVVTAVHHHRIT